MKKTFALIAASTIAFSSYTSAALVGPAGQALAAAPTTASFQDLQNVDAGLKSKIDALLAAGLFEGVSADSFGIHQSMTRAQFAKVAALLFQLKVDMALRVSAFADVRADDAANGWAIPYIEAARQAGLIDGVTATTFAPGDPVTAGQLDTLLLKGLGKKVTTTGAPWFADAVAQAGALGIHPAGKAGDAVADRADLVGAAYAARESLTPPVTPEAKPVSVVSVKAAADKVRIEAAFDQPVDTEKATLTLTRNGTTIAATPTWAADRKSVSLTSGDAFAAGDYTVTLGGLDSSAVGTASGSVTISATSSAAGDYSVLAVYELGNVLDSGITAGATGLNGLESRANAENPALSKLAKEIEVNVVSNGRTVAAPGLVQSLTSSDPSVVGTVVTSDRRGYIIGKKAGTATVSVLVRTTSGEVKALQASVVVKDDGVYGKTIKADTTDYRVAQATTTFNAYEAMDLTIVDNYGVKYEDDEIVKYNFALQTLFIASNVEGGGTVNVDADGTVHLTGTVTYFELKAVLPAGAQAVTNVTVE